jgi:hypothetical protein
LVLTELGEDNAEVTRYTRDGELVWRQSALASSTRQLRQYFVDGYPELEVLDDDRIAVLIARGLKGYEVALLDASGNVTFSYLVQLGQGVNHRMLLDRTPEGDLFLAADGYRLGAFDPDTLLSRETDRLRREYYEHEVYGLDIGSSGSIYLLTQEGAEASRRLVLDRISPSLRLIESIDYTAAVGRCDWLNDAPTELHVDRNERVAFIGAAGCIVELELPD